MSKEKLAIDGGTPVITEGIPGGMHGPTVIDQREIDAVTAVLKSQKLFRHVENSNVAAFEKEAAEFFGVKHTLMVNTGTSALICALTGAGIGPGDEVIVPAYTYISTAASVVGVGAVPVMAEIDESLGLDPQDVERKITPYTKAIIPVYMRGIPARIDALMGIAGKHNLKMVEDCCQCIGGRYKGKYVGTIGNAGALSLNYYKIITAGEGGLIYTNEYDIYEKSCYASDPATPMWTQDVDWQTPPFSRQCYRPSEVLGAIARVQLTKIGDILGHTRKLNYRARSGTGRAICCGFKC